MRRLIFALVLTILGVGFLLIAKIHAGDGNIDVPECAGTNYPIVCVTTYHKCENIGLDDACIALAQLEGQLGHSATQAPENTMSQNTVKGAE